MSNTSTLARLIALSTAGVPFSVGCGPDPESSEPIELDFRTGGSSGVPRAGSGGRGGTSGTGGQGGTTTGQGGTSAGQGGESGGDSGGPPEVTAMAPTSGPYGESVTVSGRNLGGPSVAGSRLLVGGTGEIELFPDSSAVEAWSDDTIVFRYPFPATGAVSVETDEGAALAGYFDPSWLSATTVDSAPTVSVIASLSHAPGSLFLLLDTTPPALLELGPDGVTEYAVVLGGARASSVRLYLAASGELEGIAVSDDSPSELVHLRNVSGDLVGEATSIPADATEVALAGGPDGACAWLHRDSGWVRARPDADAWVEDLGPVAEPATSGDDRSFGASSDGSLYLAWSVDSGSLLDDMQRPVMRVTDETGAWSSQANAGASVDDYVTALDIFERGRGVVIRYCGSDIDPTGISGTENRCYDALFSQGGASIPQLTAAQTRIGYAFSEARAVASGCDSESTFRIRTDERATGEAVVYPCQSLVALEVDPEGDFVPVVRAGTSLHLLGRRP